MTDNFTEKHVKYAKVPGATGVRTLNARLFLPDSAKAPHPLLIWLHAGGFRSGTIAHPAHGDIGARMATRGYAMAFIEYRLNTPAQMLSTQSSDLLGDLTDDAQMYDFGLNPHFTGPAALAAMEDCIIFFQWLDRFRDRHGIGRHVMLGGSSAGAITVLNTLFLPQHLGIRLPRISSAFAFSGAFAYPTFYEQTNTRILALHSPTDPKVPIASIRHFATTAKAQCKLIESPDHIHGDLRLNRSETRADALERIIAFDRDGSLTLPDTLPNTLAQTAAAR